uniref:Vps72/YL1 C-terminal domain-containing protein n=1 Tax=Calcidiscus leptoporus TaxID=127549 RepID=A0A7S0P4V8_9EUKA
MHSAAARKRARERARGAPAAGQAESSRVAKQSKKVQAAILKLRIDARGVQLLVPTSAESLLNGLLTRRTSPEPLPSEMEKYGQCAYSGLPARYRDPLTGMRYGSLEAFKQLRSEHAPCVTLTASQ